MKKKRKKKKKKMALPKTDMLFVEKSVIYQRSISRLNAKDIEARVLETKGFILK